MVEDTRVRSTDTVLVTGGSGVLGALVVRRLLDAGTRVRVLSRRAERPDTVPEKAEWTVGDLTAGAGLAAALDGVTAVVHCATDSRKWSNDVTAARRLTEVARASGSRPHLVYISIVGIDRVPFGYYRVKLAVERLLAESGLPFTVLRATQFHDLLLAVAQRLVRLPVVPVPSGVLFQPVETAEVADRLAELALGEPSGRVQDLGGPRVWDAVALVRALLRASGRRRLVLPLPLPGKAIKAVRGGGLLTLDGARGQRGFEEFLADAPLANRTYGAASRGGGRGRASGAAV
jgi:uncharacterized protein YbjT (DUF2867 family)